MNTDFISVYTDWISVSTDPTPYATGIQGVAHAQMCVMMTMIMTMVGDGGW